MAAYSRREFEYRHFKWAVVFLRVLPQFLLGFRM
jgi:hypothetical protein